MSETDRPTPEAARLPKCIWVWDERHDAWDTGCDEKHQFMTDGPKENRYTFCPYCGQKIKVKPGEGQG